MAEKTPRSFLLRALDELLLYSGQYALFYILMNFSASGLGYFQNLGHAVLLAILLAQTTVLVIWGAKPLPRFLLSLLAPAIYTILESREGMSFVLNMGHMFFWVFSALTGAMQAASIAVHNRKAREVLEFCITAVNVSIFIVVYFYFDVRLTIESRVAAGEIDAKTGDALMEIDRFFSSFREFVSDGAHVYLIAGAAVLTLSLSMGRIQILRLKERMSDLFGTYVDQNFRDRIVESDLTTRSEKRDLTVLFSDIRGFTSLTESYPPDAVTAMLDRYFTRWDESVRRHNGVIDKYIGDAVMVVFGLERRDEAAGDAVACAISMVRSLATLREDLAAEDLPPIAAIGIGVSSGTVILGDIGSSRRKNYTVVGDTVNVASRLEGLTKGTRSPILISEPVYRSLPTPLRDRFRLAGRAGLKGKQNKVAVYGLAETGEPAPTDLG